MKSFIDQFLVLFSQGHERTVRTKKNIAASLVIKGGSVVVGLLMVPLTIRYLNPAKYGVWLTMTSFVGWFGFFDIGLGNGLRNKFAEALAKGDRDSARMYVSTTYAFLGIIAAIMVLGFTVVTPYIDWSRIFNAPSGLADELKIVVAVVFILFVMQLLLQLISTILTADQRPAMSSLLNFVASLLSLGLIYVLANSTNSSLLYFGASYGAMPVVTLAVASLILYRTRYREFSPSLRSVEMRHARDLTGIGLQFFVIQIAVLVLFTSSNMIIAQLFGPEEVTSYNIAFKYFSVISMFFGIVTTPFWSAFTEAYHKHEDAWIRRSVRGLVAVWGLTGIVTVAMLAVSPIAYRWWVGDTVSVSFGVSAVMALFVLIYNWASIFALFLNGVGKIRLQLYNAIAVGVVNIPLSIFLAKYLHYGVAGVVMATCLCLLAGAVWAPIQYIKLMNKTAKGVWNK